MNTVDQQINKLVVKLNELQSTLHCSASASDAGIFVSLGTAISKVIDC